MPLGDELAFRYRELFRNYGTASMNDRVYELKRRLAEQNPHLREDALFFLLLNLDQMIGQALDGYIPDPKTQDLVAPVPPAFALPPDDVKRMILNALEIILGELANMRQTTGRKSSANDVIRAIEASKDRIESVVAWWKED